MGYRDYPVVDNTVNSRPEIPQDSDARYKNYPQVDSPIDIGSTALHGLWGFNRAVEGFLNIPADVAGSLGWETPRFNLEKGQSFPNPEPQNSAERIAETAGNIVGQTIPAAVIPYAIPAQAAKVIPGTVGRAVETYLQGVQNAPLRAAAGELASTLGSGLGTGIAKEAAPGSQLAEVAGAIGGGLFPTALSGAIRGAAVTPTAYLANKAYKTIRSYKEPPFPDITSEGPPLTPMQQKSAKAVQDKIGNLTPNERANLNRANEIRGKIPGFDPTLAEATDAPSLKASQLDIESRAMGQDLETLYRRKERSDLAIPAYASKVAPGKDTGPQFIVDEASGKVKALTSEIETGQSTLENYRKTIAGEALLKRGSPSDTGASIRARIIKERARAAAGMKAVAQKYGVDNVDLTTDFNEFVGEVAADLKGVGGRFGSKREPEIYSELKRMMKPAEDEVTSLEGSIMEGDLPPPTEGPKPITFDDIQSLSTRINDELRTSKLATDEGAASRKRGLVIMKARLDKMVDKLGEGSDLAENWRGFRQQYKAFKDKYDRGTIIKVRRKDWTGAYITTDENVARTFINPRDRLSIRKYADIFKKSPKGMKDLQAAFMDDFANNVVKDGVVDPQKAAAWLSRNNDILNEVPQIKGTFQDLTERNLSYKTRQAELAARQSDIEDRVLTKELKAYSMTEDPSRTLEGIIRNPAAFRDMNRNLSEEGKAGLKRWVWNYLRDNSKPGKLALSPDMIKEALGPEHYGHIQDILEAVSISNRMPYPRGVALDPQLFSNLEDFMGMKIPQALTRIRSHFTVKVPVSYNISEAAIRFLRGRSMAQQTALMRAALYDPNVAKNLRELIFAKGEKPPSARRLNMWLSSVGQSDLGDADANEEKGL